LAAISFPVPFIFVIDVTVSSRTAGKLRPKEYDLRPVLSRKAEKGLCSTCYKSEWLSTASTPPTPKGLSPISFLDSINSRPFPILSNINIIWLVKCGLDIPLVDALS
jgi:hypothetical protein